MKRVGLLFVLLMLSTVVFAQSAITPVLGDGTQSDPYQIATLENLYWIAVGNDVVPEPAQSVRWSSHYIQVADIDAAETENWFGGEGWKPIGTDINDYFSGVYNGQGHKIDNLFISRYAGHVGLFGRVYGALIEHLGVTNADIEGWLYVGGLAGYIWETTIRYCYSTGSVSGNEFAGGLTGFKRESSIYECYSECIVEATENAGGLVGMMWVDGVITNSYSKGSVSGNNYIGGLLGTSYYSEVSYCYSTGSVTGNQTTGGLIANSTLSEVIHGYYNSETSGQTTSSGGASRTTQEMIYPYAIDTYVSWDFFMIWSADMLYNANEGYPYLYSAPLSAEDAPVVITDLQSISNHPNPFNPETIVRYSLTEDVESLDIIIYNIKGQVVRTLIHSVPHLKGEYQVLWDGRDDYSYTAPSGVYFAVMTALGFVRVNKMLLLK